MKKIIALLLSLMLLLSLAACGDKNEEPQAEEPEITEPVDVEPEVIAEPEPTELPEIDKLADAALEENELKVICSCDEEIMKIAAGEFEAIFGIPVSYECMGIEDAKAAIEAGSDADIWMGVPSAILDECAEKGLFLPYAAENANVLLAESFMGTEGSWYGIFADVMGFTYNREIFDANPDAIPGSWDDLYKEIYADKLCPSLKDGNAAAAVASGEYAIAVGRVSFGVARALGGSNLDFAVPNGKLQCMVYGSAILNGCAHENTAKQWIEFVLTHFDEPVDLCHMGLFPVIADRETPAIAAALGLDIAQAEVVPVIGSEGLVELVEKLNK